MKYEKKYKEALERAKEINREHFKKGFGPSDDALYILVDMGLINRNAIKVDGIRNKKGKIQEEIDKLNNKLISLQKKLKG